MRIRTALTLGLLLALSAAGCGGGGGDGDQVATAGGTTPEASASAKPGSDDEREAIFAYAKCMRENGVPDFPDPEPGEGGGFRLSLGEGVDKAKVDAAHAKCKQLMPNGGEPPKADPERLENMRKYAKCMRENGVPKFPDPTEDGGLALDMNKLGLSGPDDPKLKAAEEKCKQFQPGGPGSGTNERKEG